MFLMKEKLPSAGGLLNAEAPPESPKRSQLSSLQGGFFSVPEHQKHQQTPPLCCNQNTSFPPLPLRAFSCGADETKCETKCSPLFCFLQLAAQKQKKSVCGGKQSAGVCFSLKSGSRVQINLRHLLFLFFSVELLTSLWKNLHFWRR